MLLRNEAQRRRLVLVSSILMILLLGSVSSGSTRSEYDILLDSTGANAGGQGDGYGGTWYYYSGSDEYVMWFYNQPYDATRIAPLDVWVYIESQDPDRASAVEVSYGWSTPDWSSLGKNHPPLPADTGHTTQSSYLQTIGVYYEDYMLLGSSSSIEPHETYQVNGNPEWICIIIRGKNIHVYRWIDHDCVTDTSGTEPDENDTGTELGAACNKQTGECYIAMSAASPYVWLGAGTSCDDCKIDTSTMDFGDAPASYPVLLSSNGARHTVKQGIYLGAGVSKDSDGKPSGTAANDDYDDGVVLTSTLVPGSSATAQITASTNGVINAWIDWNRDGDWKDAGEKILVDEPVRTGVNTVSFSVPASASLGATFARFRFSTSTGLNYTGLASDGEVEDYMVQVTSGGSGDIPGNYIAQSPSNGYYPKFSQPAKVVGQMIQGWPEASLYTSGPILADDWSDQDQRPIIGIRWWGCFTNWLQSSPPTDVPSAFHVAVWTDALGSGYPYILLWETTCTNWSWAFSGYAQDPRGILSNTSVFEFNSMLSQDKWFYPTLAKGTRYWVSISAVYGSQTPQYTWGFLTRPRNYGSAAMRIQTVGSVIAGQYGQWPPSVGSVFASGLAVTYPQSVSWDLSFELLSSKSGWGSGGSSGSSGLYGDANQDGKVTMDDMAAMINVLLGGPVFK